MRTLLLTGKGGVGKSTIAAGTAVLAARSGARTLVLSTDAAHSLSDAFGLTAGAAEPTPVDPDGLPGLFLQQVDAQRRFTESWGEIQDYLLRMLASVGVDRVAAEELTVLPGAEEVLALLELRDVARAGTWDVVVVDCAPTAETLRLLALPEALNWYVSRILPMERRVVKALRPVLGRAAGVPMPEDPFFDALERLHADLSEVRTLLTGADSSVRLVLTPEQLVLAEARRAWTSLSLYGYTVDGVVANRIFPEAGADEWRRAWVEAQREVLTEVEQSFAPLPVWRSRYRSGEPVGVLALGEMAADLYAGHDPLARVDPGGLQVEVAGDVASLVLPLPLVDPGGVDLVQTVDEVVVTVGSYRRVIALPALLGRMRATGASIEDGALKVRFRAPESSEDGSR